jgi:SAM-dependent methyltransferase
VVGVEPQLAGVEHARAVLAKVGSRAEVTAGSGDTLPFADRTVEVATLCEVIEHLENPAGVLEEVARALVPDGLLLISTPRRQAEPTDPFAVHEFDPAELQDLCQHSFEYAEVWIAEPPWLMRAWESRLGRIAVNCLARANRNPFHRRVSPTSAGTSSWRQLYAVASHPRASAPESLV